MLADRLLVRLDAQIYMEAGCYDQALQTAMDLIDKNGTVTLAEYRDALGTSRKFAVALLEQFDRARLTKKVGDARVKGENAK